MAHTLISRIVTIAISALTLNTAAATRRGKQRSRNLFFESLESRQMLSVTASLYRSSGDVYADALVDLVSNSDSDIDFGNSPYETIAVVDASADGIGLDEHGEISFAAKHRTPVGDTTAFAEASVLSVFNADVADFGKAVLTGRGDSWGEYAISDVPAGNAFFHGVWIVQALGTGYQNEDSVIDVVTNQRAEITTLSEEGEETWFVEVRSTRIQDHYPGPYHGIWNVSYHLPDRPDANFIVSQPLDELSFDITWPYDDSYHVKVSATSDNDSIEQNIQLFSQPDGAAGFAWEDFTYASLYISGDPGGPNPGDSESPPPTLAPPKVADVIIGSTVANSYGTNPDYSFNTAGADGSKEQLRTVPVGGANQLSIEFTKDVDIVQDDLTLVALNQIVNTIDGDYNRNGVVDAADYTIWRDALGSSNNLQADGDHNGLIGIGDYDVWKQNFGIVAQQSFFDVPAVTGFVAPDMANNYTATWTFASELPAAQYLLRLPDSIQDFSGRALDGEWTNPGSILSDVTTTIFPSGNNVAGGDFEFVITILPGDANRDNKVDQTDINTVVLNLGITSATFAQGDFSGEGVVSQIDKNLAMRNFGSDFQNLLILGDYDHDFDVDSVDETGFLGLYLAHDDDADLTKDNAVSQADFDAFYELLGLEIDLSVLI